MRVKCANCNMIFEKANAHAKCVSCGSNAADPVVVKAAKPERHNENEVPKGPRLLHDDIPSGGNPLLG